MYKKNIESENLKVGIQLIDDEFFDYNNISYHDLELATQYANAMNYKVNHVTFMSNNPEDKHLKLVLSSCENHPLASYRWAVHLMNDRGLHNGEYFTTYKEAMKNLLERQKDVNEIFRCNNQSKFISKDECEEIIAFLIDNQKLVLDSEQENKIICSNGSSISVEELCNEMMIDNNLLNAMCDLKNEKQNRSLISIINR